MNGRKIIIILACFLLTPCLLLSASLTDREQKKRKKLLNKEITTESGLRYVITQLGKGPRVKKGDIVSVHYTGKLENDTVFDSSYRRGDPISFKVGAGRVIKGWDEALQLLYVGDKATLIIPPSLGYGEKAMGIIPAHATLIFDIEVIAVKEAPKPFDTRGKDTLVQPSGLKIIKVKENPSGVQAAPGKMAVVHYTGYFENGEIFDSSLERDKPFQFLLGSGQVIRGWDEGIALLKTGEKARLIVPYPLAYGEQGYPGVIPPKATLIFDVELVEVK